MGDAFGLSPYFSMGNMLRRIKNKGKLLASANCCAIDFTIVSSTLKKIGRFIAPVRKSWGFSFFWPPFSFFWGVRALQWVCRTRTCSLLGVGARKRVRGHVVFCMVFTTKNRAHYDHMTMTLPLFFIKITKIGTKRQLSHHLARDHASALPVCAQSELPGLRSGKMWDQAVHLFEPAGRVMNRPHILSTAKLPTKWAGNSGTGRQCAGVGATLQKPSQHEPFDRLRANGIGTKTQIERS